MAKNEVLDRTFTIPANGKKTPIHSTLEYSSVKLGFRDSNSGSSDISEHAEIDSVRELYTIKYSNANIQCDVNENGIILVNSIYDNSMPSFAQGRPIYNLDYWQLTYDFYHDENQEIPEINSEENMDNILGYRDISSTITIKVKDTEKEITFTVNQDKPYILNFELTPIIEYTTPTKYTQNMIETIFLHENPKQWNWPLLYVPTDTQMIDNITLYSEIFTMSTDDVNGNTLDQIFMYGSGKIQGLVYLDDINPDTDTSSNNILYTAGVSNTIDSGNILDSGSMTVPVIDDTIGTGDGYRSQTSNDRDIDEEMGWWEPLMSFVDIHDIYLDRPAEKTIKFKIRFPVSNNYGSGIYEIQFKIEEGEITAVPLSLDDYRTIYSDYENVQGICNAFEAYQNRFHENVYPKRFSNQRCPCIFLPDDDLAQYINFTVIEDMTIQSYEIENGYVTCSPEFTNKIYYKVPY